MTDRHRAEAMGCAAHPQIKTTNMDRLAAEGCRFERAYTVSPVCMPARAPFINGRYPHSHGMWHNSGRMPADQETFPHHLQKAGYHTAHIGEAHYYPNTCGHVRDEERYMHARGFDYVHEVPGPWGSVLKQRSGYSDMLEEKGLWDFFQKDYRERVETPEPSLDARPSVLPTELYLDSYVGDRAVEFIEGMDVSRPNCLFVGFGGPHEPHDPPGKYATMYRPEEVPPAIAANEIHQYRLEDVQKMKAYYYGKVTLIDDKIGEILSACEKRGVLDDMLIVYTSDHGEMACDHGTLALCVFYESCISIPLIVRWPGRFHEGMISSDLVESIDVFPTLLDVIGSEPSEQCQGVSLAPLLEGEGPGQCHRDAVLSEVADYATETNERTYMLRTDRYKYAVRESGKGYQLFDLKADPDEVVNLIGTSVARSLESKMRDLLLERLLSTQTGVTSPSGQSRKEIV